jgi:hypothetical protein
MLGFGILMQRLGGLMVGLCGFEELWQWLFRVVVGVFFIRGEHSRK